MKKMAKKAISMLLVFLMILNIISFVTSEFEYYYYVISFQTIQGDTVPGLHDRVIIVDAPGEYQVDIAVLPEMHEVGEDTYLGGQLCQDIFYRVY